MTSSPVGMVDPVPEGPCVKPVMLAEGREPSGTARSAVRYVSSERGCEKYTGARKIRACSSVLFGVAWGNATVIGVTCAAVMRRVRAAMSARKCSE